VSSPVGVLEVELSKQYMVGRSVREGSGDMGKISCVKGVGIVVKD
jgi:hypothetical protein